MPSDANGVYTLPDGYLAVTGETILASQHNPPLEDLGASMTQRVMRTGATPMTGPLKLADGSASAPGLAFASTTTTGIFKTTNGIGFAIGGTQVAELVAGGFKTGARFIGEIFDWTGTTAPALCVMPYGQTLSRTTYADLWTFAQIEIAGGNAFYNNGDGSTTFGIGDCRGRVRASKDNMGGTGANRLTSTYFGHTTGFAATAIGATGGLESQLLTQAQLPNVTLSATVPSLTSNQVSIGQGNLITITPIGGGGSVKVFDTLAGIGAITTPATGITTSALGSGAAHEVVQPTIITNCALFAGA